MQIETCKARFKNDQRKGSMPLNFVARYENEEELDWNHCTWFQDTDSRLGELVSYPFPHSQISQRRVLTICGFQNFQAQATILLLGRRLGLTSSWFVRWLDGDSRIICLTDDWPIRINAANGVIGAHKLKLGGHFLLAIAVFSRLKRDFCRIEVPSKIIPNESAELKLYSKYQS